MKQPSVSLEDWCIKTHHEDILQNYNRGNNKTPASEIGKSSTSRARWKCENPKHSPWEATIAAVTWKCSGCPTCCNRRVEPGVNDILTLFPKTCEDWDYKKNKDIDIRSTAPGSQHKIWWKCSRCGKEWAQCPYQKINTRRIDIPGCVECRRLETTDMGQSLEEWCIKNRRKEVLEEYNRGGNPLPASKIGKSSGKSVTWKCVYGHIWQSSVCNRTSKKIRKCPVCGHRKLVPGVNDFGTLFPEIAKEWDYEKNYPKTPADVFPGNNTTWYWWKCDKGHSYKTKLNNKTSSANRSGCPYCQNDKVLAGFNDLETWCKKNNFEILIKEYSPDNPRKMSEILYGHDGKVKWVCSVCGHHYSSNVYWRTKGVGGCPECNKINKSSLPEQALLHYIKKVFPDAENSFRGIFSNTMELDIFIPSINTGIEYDGMAWHGSKESRRKERKKYQICKKHNVKLIRVREGKARGKLASICDECFFTGFTSRNYKELDKTICEVISTLSTSSVDVNCERDLPIILSAFMHKKTEHSLAEEYPEIAEEWDYEKNGKLTPEIVKSRSGIKVWWRCKHGHPVYKKAVFQRVKEKYGCPYCVGRVAIPGKTDILTLYPEICKQWDYEKNKNIDIRLIKPGSGKKVWWKCPEGHKWEAKVYNVTHRNFRCPYCSGRRKN